MMHLKSVVVVCVLVGVGLGKIVITVDCGYNVQVVVGSVGLRGFFHVVELFVPVQFGQHRLWVLFLDCFDVSNVTEVKLVDYVAYVKRFDLLVDH